MPTLILFLAANPTDEAQLRVGQEYKQIGAKIQAGRYRDSFELVMGPGVAIEDLQGLLLLHSPNIVHFSGHGDQNAIVLEGPDGKAQMLSERSLSGLLEIVNRDGNIKCVFLNACYSEDQARAISKNVDCVIGMTNAISDDAAREFASSFYQGLANGRNVRDSFDLGKNILAAWNLPDEQVPKLLCRASVDPALVFFEEQAGKDRTKTVTQSIRTQRQKKTTPPPAQKPTMERPPGTSSSVPLNIPGAWDARGTAQTGFGQAFIISRYVFYPNGTYEESGTAGPNPYYGTGQYSFDPVRSLLALQDWRSPAPVVYFLSNISPDGFTATAPDRVLELRRVA
ncbi:MAG TPA: CHAT domain-containing protein [Nitrososphaerales archaeon]|nr:CHAT domain-containing protein [Nitrososphaerales archaeon]